MINTTFNSVRKQFRKNYVNCLYVNALFEMKDSETYFDIFIENVIFIYISFLICYKHLFKIFSINWNDVRFTNNFFIINFLSFLIVCKIDKK